MQCICIEPFKFGGKRYKPGDEAPAEQFLIDAKLVEIVAGESVVQEAAEEAVVEVITDIEQPAEAEAVADPVDDFIGQPAPAQPGKKKGK